MSTRGACCENAQMVMVSLYLFSMVVAGLCGGWGAILPDLGQDRRLALQSLQGCRARFPAGAPFGRTPKLRPKSTGVVGWTAFGGPVRVWTGWGHANVPFWPSSELRADTHFELPSRSAVDERHVLDAAAHLAPDREAAAAARGRVADQDVL